jgi:hypothetical protein
VLAVELPIEGVKALQTLQQGASLAATAELLQQEYGEAIDLVDLVQELATLGMVACIDHVQITGLEQIGQQWLERIPPSAVSWLYSRVTLSILAVLMVTGPLLLVLVPALRPRAQDLLWSPSYALDLLLLLILGPFLLFKHELGHLLAARANGLPAELTFGHRLFYLVAVSRIGEIWKCSRARRLLIYSAGMINDSTTASLCLLLLFAASQHALILSPPLEAFLRLIVLSEYLGIAWQFQIFLKTDVYHLLTELTERHDLPERAALFLRSWWHALFPSLFPRSRRQDHGVLSDPLLIGYTALSVVGIGASCIWFIMYMLPAMFIALRGEMMLLLISIPAHNVLGVLDSLVSFGLQLLCAFLLCWSMVRRQNRQVPLSSKNEPIDHHTLY